MTNKAHCVKDLDKIVETFFLSLRSYKLKHMNQRTEFMMDHWLVKDYVGILCVSDRASL